MLLTNDKQIHSYEHSLWNILHIYSYRDKIIIYDINNSFISK